MLQILPAALICQATLTFSSCATKPSLPNATINLDTSHIVLNQTNDVASISANVTLSDGSKPTNVLYDFSATHSLPLLCIIDENRKDRNTLVISLNTGEEVSTQQTVEIYATYPNSQNKPVVVIRITVEKFIPSFPNVDISLSKTVVNLNQSNHSDTINGTITISDLTPPIDITYEHDNADNFPISFQQSANALIISLQVGSRIEKNEIILIYATYPKSSNKPRVEIQINVEQYIPPAPPPEAWDATWVPKENLIINNNVLSGVTSLSSKTILHIPKDVTTISANAFSKNKLDGITQVEFPSDSNCVTISSYAFAENSTIANIVLSPNITNLGESCFMLCSSLQELDFSKNQKITNLPKWVGAHSSNLKTLILPPNCITISNEAFEDSLGLTGNLIIPRSVTTIGEEAFLNAGYNGQGIALFFENNSTLKSVAYASFAVMKCTGTLNLPSSLKTYANNSFNSNMADLIIVNSSSGNTFGTNVLDGTKAKSLHLNIDNYFAYPKDFLSFSYIKENADGKIYVPNSLLDDFKSGWTDFTTKISSL